LWLERLANAIQPDIIRKINTRPIALLEMENIGFYLKACWKLGVASAELFVTSDLYLRKGELQVAHSSFPYCSAELTLSLLSLLMVVVTIGRCSSTCCPSRGSLTPRSPTKDPR
jgi:hypothetical protein